MEIRTKEIDGKRYICVDDVEKYSPKDIIGWFDKVKFGNILAKIDEIYKTQRDFARLSGVNRNYISQYTNIKMTEPPGPKILRKLAKASKGVTTYKELMQVCGYLDGIED